MSAWEYPVLAWYSPACEIGAEPKASSCIAIFFCFLRCLWRVCSESDPHVEPDPVCRAFMKFQNTTVSHTIASHTRAQERSSTPYAPVACLLDISAQAFVNSLFKLSCAIFKHIMLYAGNMSTMSEDGLSSDTETLALWGHFQNALEELEQDRSRIGFLDVAVFGAQSSGKSSLLSTLCGLQLPTGTGSAVTRCPIRISVTDNDESFLHMPGRSKEQIPLPQAGTKPCLTEDIYNQALHQLSAGAMTAKELEIRVGRPGHLPLNIVDTPGLIINDVPDRPGGAADQDRACWLRPARQTFAAHHDRHRQ